MFSLKRSDESLVESARHRFVYSISSALPPKRVFDIVANTDREAEWFPDFVSAEWQTPPPRGTGSVRLYRLKYMIIVEEFLVWDRGHRLVFRLNQCSLPILREFIENYVFQKRADGGTDLRWEICYRPNPWLAFLHPLVRPFFAADFAIAAKQLQALLNTEQTPR